MKWLALGDSYTCGEGVGRDEAWPALLSRWLAGQGVTEVETEVIARTGWTSGELLSALDDAAPEGPFDLVTLLVGVNNQYRGQSISSFSADLCSLLDRAVEWAGGAARRVVMISIPDWGATPFADGRDRRAIAASIDAFNRIAATVARKGGIPWVDITDISRRGATRPAWMAGDGLHPGSPMYAAWVDRIGPAALRALAVSPDRP
ncbi:MAG: GDSL-type esterase/lipase family protein [Rhodothermales bacterium]